jgi:hypothetical protein
MGSHYPELNCPECRKHARMIAVCENPETENETRFYECSSPKCRYSFQACVPTLQSSGWIGLRAELFAMREPGLSRR